jgi:hypothetical protein
MRFFPILSITTIEPYIAQPATTPFRWGWDFNHWVPWMLQYPLQPPRQTHIMLQLELTKPPISLSGSSTSANRFRIFYRSTSSSMINIGCHTCRKKTLEGLIESFFHFFMDPTPSPRLWVTMILSSTFPPSLACTQCSMWTSFSLIFHHYWTPQR